MKGFYQSSKQDTLTADLFLRWLSKKHFRYKEKQSPLPPTQTTKAILNFRKSREGNGGRENYMNTEKSLGT